MDYKSDYRFEGKDRIMIVKASSLGPIFLFILAVFAGFLFFALWNAQIWWLLLGNGLGALFFVVTGILLMRKKLEIRVTEEFIVFDQTTPLKSKPQIKFSISEVEFVKKNFTSVSTGKGQRVDVYPIYLVMKDGMTRQVTEIISDVKMADEIREFLINRAGLKGGSFIRRL